MPDDEEKPWAVRVAGQEMQIRDLPVGVLNKIAKDTGQSWMMGRVAPLLDLDVAVAVLKAVCKQLDVEMPTDLTGRTIFDYFVEVEDDLPEQFENGVPQ